MPESKSLSSDPKCPHCGKQMDGNWSCLACATAVAQAEAKEQRPSDDLCVECGFTRENHDDPNMFVAPSPPTSNPVDAADIRQDAERYRWLRLHSYVERTDLSNLAIIYGTGYTQTRPDFLDDDIDAAMSADVANAAPE